MRPETIPVGTEEAVSRPTDLVQPAVKKEAVVKIAKMKPKKKKKTYL
jgi:hypothetical protein